MARETHEHLDANTLCNACSSETVAQNFGPRMASALHHVDALGVLGLGAPSFPMSASSVPAKYFCKNQCAIKQRFTFLNVGRCSIANAPAMALPSGKRYRTTVRGS